MLPTMKALAHPLALVTIAVSSGAAVAQIRRGDSLPAFQFIESWNGAPKTFAELAGKVVILDFTQSW